MSSVRYAARSALGQFSLEQFINAYWATQHQALIPFIATRLYHTPLSVQHIPYSQDQRLLLYPMAGKRVKWEKNHQEVQRLVQLIKSAAKQWTPLMSAAAKGNLELAQLLVDKEVDVNQATADGRTPLWIAAQKGHLAVVEYLQKAGANIETPDKEGKTPLMIAAKHGHLAVVECLQKAGASLEATDKEGKTPLHLAAQEGHLAVVEYLQEAGANIETPDKYGWTPLMIAKQHDRSAVVQFWKGRRSISSRAYEGKGCLATPSLRSGQGSGQGSFRLAGYNYFKKIVLWPLPSEGIQIKINDEQGILGRGQH